MKMDKWLINRNDARYPDMANPQHPKFLNVYGTKEQAKWVAEALSIYDVAGCDYFYYVVDDED